MFYNLMMSLFTRYTSNSNTQKDNLKRAELLGFPGKGIKIAPGACVRVKDGGGIGKNTFIGLYSYVNGLVTIEDDVWIGPHCSLAAGNHKYDPKTGWFSDRTSKPGETHDSIFIGRGSWIATGVTVTAGVKIGKANLVCANAVVTKSTPDYAIVAGTPAKVVGMIDKDTGEYKWGSKDERK